MSTNPLIQNTWPQVFQDFSTFVKDSQIVNVAIGFLIAQATMDSSKSFVSSIIMPLIQGLRTLKAPVFPIANFVGSLITFFITLFVAFVFIKVLRLQAKPIPAVFVANSATPLV